MAEVHADECTCNWCRQFPKSIRGYGADGPAHFPLHGPRVRPRSPVSSQPEKSLNELALEAWERTNLHLATVMASQPEKRHSKRRPKPKGLWQRFLAWLYRKPRKRKAKLRPGLEKALPKVEEP